MGKTVYVLFERYGDAMVQRGWFDTYDDAKKAAKDNLKDWCWEIIAVDKGFRKE